MGVLLFFMGSHKISPPKGLEGRTSRGKVLNSSNNIFRVLTHRMQNDSYAQKREITEEFFITKQDSRYFKSPKTDLVVRVVFNNREKQYIEEIYDFNWNLIYIK